MLGHNNAATNNYNNSPVRHETRLIPGSPSQQNYRQLSLLSHAQPDIDGSMVVDVGDVSLREDGFIPQLANTRDNHEREVTPLVQTGMRSPGSDVASGSSTASSPKSPKSDLDIYIADALGFQKQERVLNYQELSGSPTRKKGTSPRKMASEMGDLMNQLAQMESLNLVLTTSRSAPRNKEKMATNSNATTILQAPGLRNDFYSNLVSWSKKTGHILIGLKNQAFLWCVNNNVEPINIGSHGIVTAVSCSPHNYFAVATLTGLVLIGELVSRRILASAKVQDNCVYCLEWSKDSQIILAGDARGAVIFLQICQKDDAFLIVERSQIKTNTEQVCGIAISSDFKEMAVGGNDNKCSIWNIEHLEHPQLMHTLPHTAAVKALAYCPWSTSLLASGGGSKDRHVRFWHSKSGTLIQELRTEWQITSILWSGVRKQLAVTFGFSTGKKDIMIRIFSYPNMQIIREVEAAPNTRTLSACLSPDGQSICTAVNDQTIHIYKVWANLLQFTPPTHAFGKGSYRSTIIELIEGVDETGDLIR